MWFDRNRLTAYALALAVAVTAAVVGAAPTSAQVLFSLEARTGATLGFGDIAPDGSVAGLIGGVDAFVGVAPMLSVYGGWGYHGFSGGVSASGPRVGVKALFPQPGGSTPWVRAGATFNQGKNGAGVSSDRALGLEAGAGFDFEVAPRVSITPALRFHNFTATFGADETTYTYLTIDLGVHFHF